MVRIILTPLLIFIALAAMALSAQAWAGAWQDEFGRNFVASTTWSLLRSIGTALWISTLALAPPVLVAYFVADSNSRAPRAIAYAVTRVLDTIPLFLWIAIAYSALGLYGELGRQLAITLVSFPFVLGLVLARFVDVAKAPFIRNARGAGVPAGKRFWRVFVPNAASALAYPFIAVLGASLTFDAVIGLLGMGTRSELSLGALLWRARERASIDPSLVAAALIALALAMLVFFMLRQALGAIDPKSLPSAARSAA